MREVLTFILAGGRGERLHPLTKDRAKPAVPFGGIYRIIDFTLSNCINSGLRRIYVLIQYKSFSLQEHIFAGWNVFSHQLGEFIDVIPPQQRISSDWYQGTANAIYQNLYAVHDHQPELVLVLAGDHIYKMDYMKMIDRHKETNADMTVACVEFDKRNSKQFGVIEVNKKGRVCGFQEKPDKPKTIPGKPSKILASMGIYLFNSEVLLESLEADAHADSEHDFGKDVIPQMVKNKKKVYSYSFVDKKGKSLYWRDIGTRDAYYQSNMDLLDSTPEFDLYDKSWPVRTYPTRFPPAKIVSATSKHDSYHGSVVDSILGGGCIVNGAHIHKSVLSSNIFIENHAKINNSIIMENVVVGEHAEIKNAIIDKEVVIPPHTKIGYDLNGDDNRFAVTSSGIVIVSKKTVIA